MISQGCSKFQRPITKNQNFWLSKIYSHERNNVSNTPNIKNQASFRNHTILPLVTNSISPNMNGRIKEEAVSMHFNSVNKENTGKENIRKVNIRDTMQTIVKNDSNMLFNKGLGKKKVFTSFGINNTIFEGSLEINDNSKITQNVFYEKSLSRSSSESKNTFNHFKMHQPKKNLSQFKNIKSEIYETSTHQLSAISGDKPKQIASTVADISNVERTKRTSELLPLNFAPKKSRKNAKCNIQQNHKATSKKKSFRVKKQIKLRKEKDLQGKHKILNLTRLFGIGKKEQKVQIDKDNKERIMKRIIRSKKKIRNHITCIEDAKKLTNIGKGLGVIHLRKNYLKRKNKHFLIKAKTQIEKKLYSSDKLGKGVGRRLLRMQKPKVVNMTSNNNNILLEPETNKTSTCEYESKKILCEKPSTENKIKHVYYKSNTQPLPSKNKITPVVTYFRSKDTHIKRFLKSLGVEIRSEKNQPNKFNTFEELNWVVQDNGSDYRRLRISQLYNHFENNDQLTQKRALSSNIESSTTNIDFYPKTFSLASKEERYRFKEQFFLRVSFKLLKKHIKYFELKLGGFVEKVSEFLHRKWDRFFQKKLDHSSLEDKLFFDKYQSKYVKLSSDIKDSSFVVNTLLLDQMLYLWKSITRQLIKVEDEVRFFPPLKFDQELRKRFEQYADLQINYETLDLNTRREIGLADEYWKTPNNTLVVMLLDIHVLFSKRITEYSEPSDKNLWIVKPGCNSKGVGIFVTKDMPKIRQAWKNNVDRLVQKYIEDCLLIEGRKFDLRVWVLIESLDPLKIWIFQDYYLRFCYDKFDLERLDSTRHLTNFAVNKEKFAEDTHKSVMSRQQFLNYLKKYPNLFK